MKDRAHDHAKVAALVAATKAKLAKPQLVALQQPPVENFLGDDAHKAVIRWLDVQSIVV